MKRLILILSLIFSVVAANAQDVIVLKDASTINARVVEVGTELIKYYRFDNLEGPIYTIERAKVFIIRYENGTREVISQLDAEPQDVVINNTSTTESSDKYAHISTALERVKEDLHKKKFYFTAQANLGYSICADEDAPYTADGLSTGLDLFGEFFPSKKSASGIVAGLGYNYKRYVLSIMDQHVNLDAFDINIGYTYRSDISKFFMKAMLNINIPFSAYVPSYYFTNDQSIDMMPITHTTVGILYDAGAHFGGFNVGGRLGIYFNDQFEECAPALAVGVHVGYTF